MRGPVKQKRRVRRLVRCLQRLSVAQLDTPGLIPMVRTHLRDLEPHQRRAVAKSMLRMLIEMPEDSEQQQQQQQQQQQPQQPQQQPPEGARSSGDGPVPAEGGDAGRAHERGGGQRGQRRQRGQRELFGALCAKTHALELRRNQAVAPGGRWGNQAEAEGQQAGGQWARGLPSPVAARPGATTFLDTALQLCIKEKGRITAVLLSGGRAPHARATTGGGRAAGTGAKQAEEESGGILLEVETCEPAALRSHLGAVSVLIADLKQRRAQWREVRVVTSQ